MLPWLFDTLRPRLDAAGLDFLRVLTSLTFQTVAATLLAFGLVLLLGPRTIAALRRARVGDNPEFDNVDVNKMMADKRGTPTMGGLLIVPAILLATLLLADLRSPHVGLALLVGASLAALGATDDWLKLTKLRRKAAGRPDRQGLKAKPKLAVQIALGLIVCGLTYLWADGDAGRRMTLPLFKPETGVWLSLGPIAFTLLGAFVLTGASNAVNLTDGLDGLAAGCTALVAFTLAAFGLIAGEPDLSSALLYPHLPNAGQLAVVAGAVGGASLGFLWFNCNPARVFMGDTGSLALGGLLGYVAFGLRQEVLLALVGAVFVAESLSVMLQVGYFKWTKRRFGEGRRIFRMSPLHHHFQKCDWHETQIVVRFWLIGAVLAVVGLATIKLR